MPGQLALEIWFAVAMSATSVAWALLSLCKTPPDRMLDHRTEHGAFELSRKALSGDDHDGRHAADGAEASIFRWEMFDDMPPADELHVEVLKIRRSGQIWETIT